MTVEFYGIPRLRTGVPSVEVEAATLGEVFTKVGDLFPALAETCFDGDRLRPTFVANVNGDRFTRNPAVEVRPGDQVLLLSADAGG